MKPIHWLFLSVLLNGVCEYFAKKYVACPTVKRAVFVCLISAISTCFWLPAMLETDALLATGVIWLCLSTCLLLILGLVVFHEHLSGRQVCGLVLALAAICLLNKWS